MSKSNILIICISLVALFVIMTFGITYSYFSPRFINGKSTSYITVISGKMAIDFTDSNPNITFSNVIPGPTSSLSNAILNKNFIITGENTTDLNMEYKLNIKVTTNEFANGEIGYILIGKNNSNVAIVTNSKTAFTPSSINTINKGTNLTISLGNGYFTKSTSSVKHEYSLYLFYIDTGAVQNSQNCKFNGYLSLSI